MWHYLLLITSTYERIIQWRRLFPCYKTISVFYNYLPYLSFIYCTFVVWQSLSLKHVANCKNRRPFYYEKVVVMTELFFHKFPCFSFVRYSKLSLLRQHISLWLRMNLKFLHTEHAVVIQRILESASEINHSNVQLLLFPEICCLNEPSPSILDILGIPQLWCADCQRMVKQGKSVTNTTHISNYVTIYPKVGRAINWRPKYQDK
jgi:hypothetical protein